ncbi:MAG TPA: single-stranded-DNA-specific exonuclease RecJ [Clostridiales bacterium]|jgi:single-stranded-DNA-specific exonuclease|nr:single-stranded-DNA-specific exonuclease RecJ [Clostridiales bacterium]
MVGRKGREKVWNIRYIPGDGERDREIDEISGSIGVSRTLAALLHNRGYTTPEAAERFLKNEESILHDPFLLRDMDRAVRRIWQAIQGRERIVIYGDYDVDGVTSVALLWLHLKSKGADVGYYIPSRSGEGYGLSCNAIDSLKKEGTDLIITVDTGITAGYEAEYASALGIDIVITDHHECREELPAAAAVVNPHRPDCSYPFPDLAGAGVVFKLLCACEIAEARERGEAVIAAVRRVCLEYADLVAIGTVADVMPLKDENRLLVLMGIRLISETKRPGLAALIEASSGARGGSGQARKRKITSNYIGYGIAPRLNAAGRISDATTAVRLLLSDKDDEAATLARELCEINTQRQIEENRIAEQAYRKIEREFDFSRDKVIVLEDDGWQQGIIGIVSSRITERYGLPSVLISFDGSTRGYSSGDDAGKGSGRSVKGMNLVEALKYCEDLLIKYGGHELAAGLTIERAKVPGFRRRINEYAAENLSEEDLAVRLEADCVLSLPDLTLGLASELYHLEPYGVGNPVPTFIVYDVQIARIMHISSGRHTKLLVSDGDTSLYGIYFNMPVSRFPLHEGERADILFTLDINEFQNLKSVQMIIQDVRMSKKSSESRRLQRQRYEEILSGGEFDLEEDFIPDREDCAAVYRVLRRQLRLGHDTLSERMLLSLLWSCEPERQINYVKLMYILRIFRELKICSIEKISEGLFSFDMSYKTSRTSIDKSTILRKLRIQCRNRG